MSNAKKIFFTLSILLNVGLGGVVLGHVYRMTQEGPFAEVRGDLSPETRALMRQTYKDKYKEIWALRDQMREKKDSLKQVVVAEKFDVKSFEDAANALRAQTEKAFDSRVDSFGKILSAIPKTEREIMAPQVVDVLAGHRKWDHRKGKLKPEDHRGPNPTIGADQEDKQEGAQPSPPPIEAPVENRVED